MLRFKASVHLCRQSPNSISCSDRPVQSVPDMPPTGARCPAEPSVGDDTLARNSTHS